MCAVKLSCVLALTQKYHAVNKEEIRLTKGGQGSIKYPFLLTKGKCFPMSPAMAHAQCCRRAYCRLSIRGVKYLRLECLI